MPQLNTSTKTSACFYQTNLNAHMCTPTSIDLFIYAKTQRPTLSLEDTPTHALTQRCGCIHTHTNTEAHNFPLRNPSPTRNAAAYTHKRGTVT